MHGNEMLKQKFYFLKLPKNWLSSARMKKLRRKPNGDTLVIIYLQLLMLSINHNNCFIYEEIEQTIEEEIALKIDEDVELVKETWEFIKENGLLQEMKDNEYHLIEADGMSGSETYSNILKKNSNGLEKFQPISNHYIDKEEDIEKELDKKKISNKRKVGMELPLIDGTTYQVSDIELSNFKQLYPAVDVEQELRSMLGWLIANPKNRKTRVGTPRFINAWLSKRQDSSRVIRTQPIIEETKIEEKPKESVEETPKETDEEIIERMYKQYGE